MKSRTRSLVFVSSILALGLVQSSALAARTTKNPTFTARRAYQQAIQRETGKLLTGGKVHAHDAYYLGWTKGNDWTFGEKKDPGLDYQKTVAWQGPERGPAIRCAAGPFNVRLLLVPAAKDLSPAQLVGKTLVSSDLTQLGADQVKAHLLTKGLAPVSVRLGDFSKPIHYEYGNTKRDRLSQKPVSRASGYLRYSVEFADGTLGRYLVRTNSQNLAKGQDGRALLGKVFADTDVYQPAR
jgi:hypothetical protein